MATLRSILDGLNASDWIAAAALLVALYAAATTRRSVRMQQDAQEDLRRERDTRAVLEASFEPATFRASGSGGFFPGTLIIENTGDRSSGRADVEFYVAAAVSSQGLCWEDEQAKQDRARARVADGVVFTDDCGNQTGALRLDRTIDTITPTLPARLRVVLPLEVPKDRMTIQIRAIVHAEHATERLDAPMTFDIIRNGP
jgi:hypothetical protein